MGDPDMSTIASHRMVVCVVPACPEAWRDDLARGLAPVVNVSFETLRARLKGDPPFVLVSLLSSDKMAAVEAVCTAQQVRCEWQEVVTVGDRVRGRLGLIAAALFCAASTAFVVWTPWHPHQTTIRIVSEADMPAPIRSPFDDEGMGAGLGQLHTEALRRRQTNGVYTLSPIPGAHLCTLGVAYGRLSTTCYRDVDTCQGQRGWIDTVTTRAPFKVHAELQDAVTGFEIWTATRPDEPTPEGLCRATVHLHISG